MIDSRALEQAVLTGWVASAALGCGEPAADQVKTQLAEAEDAPAPPCSVNAMIRRDTAATDFVDCGEDNLPFMGDAAACIERAAASASAFVLRLDTPRPVPPTLQPTLVGAVFDGEFRLRMYMGQPGGVGERSEMELLRLKPTEQQYSMMATDRSLARCVRSATPPGGVGGQDEWVALGKEGRHSFHPRRCIEWFDDAKWNEQAWVSGFDRAVDVTCSLR